MGFMLNVKVDTALKISPSLPTEKNEVTQGVDVDRRQFQGQSPWACGLLEAGK